MNGEQLSRRIDALAKQLQGESRFALAYVLAIHALTFAACTSAEPEQSCDIAAAALLERLRSWRSTAKSHHATRRIKSALRKLEDPRPRRARRRRKRQATDAAVQA